MYEEPTDAPKPVDKPLTDIEGHPISGAHNGGADQPSRPSSTPSYGGAQKNDGAMLGNKSRAPIDDEDERQEIKGESASKK